MDTIRCVPIQLLALAALVGCRSATRPAEPGPARVAETGIASWYGPGFHGKPTASGEIYDQNALTAAHRTLPLGTVVIVTNLDNGRTVQVRINDRGPFVGNRMIDLSYAAALAIGSVGPGTVRARLEVVDGPVRVDSIRGAVVYTLQLGSFSSRENAEQLRARVATSFHDATVVLMRGRDATVYRVQLGSFTDRGAADEQAQRVRRAGYEVIVVEK